MSVNNPGVSPHDQADYSRAMLNILDDFVLEGQTLKDMQRGILNILEDSTTDRIESEQAFRASLNMLSDLSEEKGSAGAVQQAMLNLLDDFNEEKDWLKSTQRGILNILEDFDVERQRAERAYHDLVKEMSGRKAAEDALQRAKVAEENLRRARDAAELARHELERSNGELQSFSYSVAHDLRAPLRAIDGFTQILLTEHTQSLDDEGKRLLDIVAANVMGMGRLIDGLLAVSRLGRAGLTPTDVDMTDLARGVVEQLVGLERDRKVEVALQPLGSAHCDPTMMRQVWANLVSNALKFTRKRALARIEIGCRQEDHETVYFVRDDGAGFDMKYSDKLFGIFQRLHAATDFDGAGIGLAIVHRIVERHSGRVWAEGSVGHGATFYFALPRENDGV